MNLYRKIAEICPNTMNRFLSDMMLNYGINFNDFCQSGLFLQYRHVKRYFGYSMNVEINDSDDAVQDEIKYIFEDFESLISRYPGGVPDPLKAIKEMSNDQRTQYLDKNYKRTVNISLKDAICQISHFCRPSLRNALTIRVPTILEEIVKNKRDVALKEDMFWENIKKEFKKELVAPF